MVLAVRDMFLTVGQMVQAVGDMVLAVKPGHDPSCRGHAHGPSCRAPRTRTKHGNAVSGSEEVQEARTWSWL
jgi:hypothetical protein